MSESGDDSNSTPPADPPANPPPANPPPADPPPADPPPAQSESAGGGAAAPSLSLMVSPSSGSQGDSVSVTWSGDPGSGRLSLNDGSSETDVTGKQSLSVALSAAKGGQQTFHLVHYSAAGSQDAEAYASASIAADAPPPANGGSSQQAGGDPPPATTTAAPPPANNDGSSQQSNADNPPATTTAAPPPAGGDGSSQQTKGDPPPATTTSAQSQSAGGAAKVTNATVAVDPDDGTQQLPRSLQVPTNATLTLQWSTDGATGVNIEPLGSFGPSGSTQLPAQDATYRIVPLSDAGQGESWDIEIHTHAPGEVVSGHSELGSGVAQVLSFTATDESGAALTSIASGEKLTLTVVVTDVTESVAINQTEVALSESQDGKRTASLTFPASGSGDTELGVDLLVGGQKVGGDTLHINIGAAEEKEKEGEHELSISLGGSIGEIKFGEEGAHLSGSFALEWEGELAVKWGAAGEAQEEPDREKITEEAKDAILSAKVDVPLLRAIQGGQGSWKVETINAENWANKIKIAGGEMEKRKLKEIEVGSFDLCKVEFFAPGGGEALLELAATASAFTLNLEKPLESSIGKIEFSAEQTLLSAGVSLLEHVELKGSVKGKISGAITAITALEELKKHGLDIAKKVGEWILEGAGADAAVIAGGILIPLGMIYAMFDSWADAQKKNDARVAAEQLGNGLNTAALWYAGAYVDGLLGNPCSNPEVKIIHQGWLDGGNFSSNLISQLDKGLAADDPDHQLSEKERFQKFFNGPRGQAFRQNVHAKALADIKSKQWAVWQNYASTHPGASAKYSSGAFVGTANLFAYRGIFNRDPDPTIPSQKADADFCGIGVNEAGDQVVTNANGEEIVTKEKLKAPVLSDFEGAVYERSLAGSLIQKGPLSQSIAANIGDTICLRWSYKEDCREVSEQVIGPGISNPAKTVAVDKSQTYGLTFTVTVRAAVTLIAKNSGGGSTMVLTIVAP